MTFVTQTPIQSSKRLHHFEKQQAYKGKGLPEKIGSLVSKIRNASKIISKKIKIIFGTIAFCLVKYQVRKYRYQMIQLYPNSIPQQVGFTPTYKYPGVCVTTARQSRIIDAIRSNNVLMLRRAIANGANVNAGINYLQCKRPIMLAINLGFPNMVHELLIHGADPDNSGTRTHTPLHFAINNIHHTNQYKEIAKLLINNGADIKKQTTNDENNKITPLLLSVLRNDKELTSLLLSRGANINHTGFGINCSPLHLAIKNNNFELLKLLIHHNAKLYIKDRYNRTPIDYAQKLGHYKLLSYLLPN